LFDGSYLLEYYSCDIPFLFLFAILCFILIEKNPKQLLYIYFPVVWLIVLIIHWSIWGIGPDYSWRIQFNSIVIDAVSHGLPFYCIYFISKRLLKNKSKVMLYILFYVLYLILAVIIIQVVVYLISWLLYL
jgi:hypothetical protein